MTYKFLEIISSILLFTLTYLISIFLHKILLKLHIKNSKEEIYDLHDVIEVESNGEVITLFRNKKTDVYERLDVTTN